MPDPIRNITDAWVTSKRPKLNRNATARLKVSAGGDGNQHRIYLYFSLPFPIGTNVLSAKIRMRNADAFTGGAIGVTAKRVTSKWSASKVTWDNKPTTTATNAVTVTKTNAADGTVWEWDINAMMQTVSNSGVWWGLEFVTDAATAKNFHSSQAKGLLRPEVEITWGDEPDAPDELSPSQGRAVKLNKPLMEFDFDDRSGDTELNACQIHFKASNTGWNEETGFSSPTWDSGTQFVSEPQLDLATTVGAPTLAANTLTWWTVRVQDSAGLWSDYSEPTSFQYVPALAVTLDSPAASPNNFVNDSTPPILWTVTGTQSAYKILISLAATPDVPIWTSGKVSTPDSDMTLPPRVIKKHGETYHIALLVWDATNREKNGDTQIYTRVDRDFTFNSVAGVTGVTNVVATQTAPWPWVDITWTRATAADEYNIYRDDELIESNVPASEVSIGGTSYSYRDRLATPRESHTWKVEAVVNTQASNPTQSNAIQTRLLTTMMMELDGTSPLFFMNPDVAPQSRTMQEVHQPLNASPVLITQYMGGFEGKLEGVLADDIIPNTSAREMRNRFKKWKRQPGTIYYLYMIDEVLKIVPYNMTYRPAAKSGNMVMYRVSFDFFEVD